MRDGRATHGDERRLRRPRDAPRVAHVRQQQVRDAAVRLRAPVHAVGRAHPQLPTEVEVQVEHVAADLLGRLARVEVALDDVEPQQRQADVHLGDDDAAARVVGDRHRRAPDEEAARREDVAEAREEAREVLLVELHAARPVAGTGDA